MLKQLKTKLIVSLVAVVLAIILLVSVSLAWFSVSTSPEVGNVTFSITLFHTLQVGVSPDGPWLETVDVGASFTDVCRVLQPVSTIDGINWFACTYDENGEMNPPSLFDHSDTLEWGNIRLDAQVKDASGTDITNEEDRKERIKELSHFVYTDVWLRSENPDGCDVYLSVPHEVSEGELSGTYGTYVLPKFIKSSGSDITNISYAAETAIRVGFQIFGNGGDASPTDFIIFEPNADKRSSAEDKEGAGNYIVAYAYDSYTYTDDYYIKTQPLGYAPVYEPFTVPPLFVLSGGEMVPYEGTEYVSTTDYYVTTDTDYVSATDAVAEFYGTDHVKFDPPGLYRDGVPVSLSDLGASYEYLKEIQVLPVDYQPDKLISQRGGTWDPEKVKEALETQAVYRPNSTDVASFGTFINTKELYEQDTTGVLMNSVTCDRTAGNAVILSLPDNNPVKIRLFIWLEGQDVDCWNDIHAGTFVVNLEFAGVDH